MNGVYLFMLLRELKPRITNQFIHQVSIKGRLVQIEFGNDALFISLFPQALGIFIDSKKKDFERIQNFTDCLVPGKIIDVKQIDLRPVCELIIEKKELHQVGIVKVRISFYREAPNFTLITERSKRSLFPRDIEKGAKRSFFEIQATDLQNKESLVRNFEGLDRSLARELDWQKVQDLKEILSGKKTKVRLVSVFPLAVSLFADNYVKEYESWNDLFAEGIKGFIEKKAEYENKARSDKEIKKLTEKLKRLKEKLEELGKIEDYRIFGELLLMNATQVKKGMDRIMVFNPYTQRDIEINLDPAKSVQENAQEYFKRYKKLKRGLPIVQRQIQEIEERISRLKSGEEVIKEKRVQVTRPVFEQKEVLPFKEFILPSGARVYVGKSAESNMLLTFKYARPDDYFFHVRGYEGAHTLLRTETKKTLKREDIEMAASIAAYFSKAKKQKRVPVSYTQRKYLKKNKKGKLGSVILMREDVIFVDPKLP
ncbi:MAG: NFACT RNA binding domain-containing protein [candidate division WOR-3 bacterium]